MRTIKFDLGNGLQTINLDDASYSAITALLLALLGSRNDNGRRARDGRLANSSPMDTEFNCPTFGAPDDDY